MANTQLRILMVAYGHRDKETADKHRIVELARALRDQGHDVILLWFYPFQVTFRKYHFSRLEEKAKIICVPTFPFSVNRFLGWLGRYWCGHVTRRLISRFGVQVVHAETALCATFVPAKRNIPLVVDYHGDIPAEMKMMRRPDWSIVQARRDERLALERADAVLAVSEPLKKKLLSEGPPERKLLSRVVPCGVIVDRFDVGFAERFKVRRNLGVGDRMVLCYCGGLTCWQCIEETLELVAELRRRNPAIFFLFLTSGGILLFEGRLKRIGQEGRDYRHLALRPAEVPGILPAADVGLLLRADSPVNTVASPTKLGEYLAAGLAVIATVHAGEASGILRKGDCGFVLSGLTWLPQDVDAASAFVKKVFKKREDYAARSRETAKKMISWETSVANLQCLYAEIADRFRDAREHNER